MLTAPPYRALAAESLLGLQRRRAVDRQGPSLRTDPRERQRRRRHARDRRLGQRPRVRRADESPGREARAVQHLLREPRSGSTRRRTTRAPTDLAELATELLANPLFAKVADSGTATIRSGNVPRQLDEPQHAARQRPHGRRRQDRPHDRSRLRAHRFGDPRWHPAHIRRARRAQRGGPRRRDREAPRLRLLSVQVLAARRAGRGARRPRARLSRREPRAGREARRRGLGPRGPARRDRGRGAGRGQRRGRGGRGARAASRSPSTAGSPTRCRWSRPNRSRRRR